MAPAVFRCVTDGSLIPSPKIGDGSFDCADGSDETQLVRKKEEEAAKKKAAKEKAAKEEAEEIEEVMREISETNRENGIGAVKEKQEVGGWGHQQDLGNLAGGGDSSTNAYLAGGGAREVSGGSNSDQPPASCWNVDISDLPTAIVIGKYFSLHKVNF